MSEWDGPVLATSIKTDVLHQTLAARSELGEARVFDPTQATSLGHAVWSPLQRVDLWTGARRTAAGAARRGRPAPRRSADDAFWRPAGARYLAAAPVRRDQGHRPDDGRRPALDRDLRVRRAHQAPRRLQADRRPTPAIDSIQSVKGADHRFASSLLQTIATALDAWQEPQVAGATMGESRISADWLLGGANTLYLVAPANDQRRLSGLFAALVAHIVAGAYERSATTGRPIDPALLLALDEVCNIAPLPNLDEIASTGPGQGVHLLCVLQNISQGYDRWGRDRAETIIANHRARLFCSGIGDRATLDYLRGTLGDEEIARISTQQRSIATPGSRTRSTEHRPLAAPHRVRQADRPKQPARLRPPRARLDHPPRPPRRRRAASDRSSATAGRTAAATESRSPHRHGTRPRSSTREHQRSSETRTPIDPSPDAREPVDCLRPSFADRRPDGFKVATASLPLARGLGSASGRRPAFRATSTTGSPQGGNQR